jgi:hypothetical protein
MARGRAEKPAAAAVGQNFSAGDFDRLSARSPHAKGLGGRNRPALIVACRSLITPPSGAYRKFDMDILAPSSKVEARHPVHLGLVEIVNNHVAKDNFTQLATLGKNLHKACVGHSLFEISEMCETRCGRRMN